MRKIFIIAGEASGDLHGANLVRSLLSEDPNLIIGAYGGPKMSRAGANVVRRYEDFAFMGFYEVLKNARKVLRNISKTVEVIIDFGPEQIIFIDFPGFNLRVAEKLKSSLKKCKFNYYISPKVWAWKTNRVHKINDLMDRVFVIFPFEEAFYQKFGYTVTYVGNPLLDEVHSSEKNTKTKNLIAVLPGSRRQEIEKMLPIFSEVSTLMPEYEFEVSVMPQHGRDFYARHSDAAGTNLKFSERSTYELLDEAAAALVTSGTATLETALFNTPQIVAYKTSPISYAIGKRVIKVKYISLVNLILDRPAVEEILQNELTPNRLCSRLQVLFLNQHKLLEDYQELRQILGKPGASDRTARLVLASDKV